ncbi:MAG TPA: hypothetical protein VFN76_09955 [Candidatus Limnocylindria bacterium]|nr:hypothetical protein [Candidatus Limnocylindria bacterium]
MTARAASAAPQLYWQEPMPTEVRLAIEPHLHRFLYLLPGWCYELRIGWDEADANGILKTNIIPEYRGGRLTVCPGFFRRSEEQRQDDVVHEMVHFSIEPLRDVACGFVDEIEKAKPGFKDMGVEAVRKAVEGAVCDVTELVFRALGRRSS